MRCPIHKEVEMIGEHRDTSFRGFESLLFWYCHKCDSWFIKEDEVGKE